MVSFTSALAALPSQSHSLSGCSQLKMCLHATTRHGTFAPHWGASSPVSAGARLSFAAGEDLPVPGSGRMSPPFHRDPRRETGQSSSPVGAEGRNLSCNCLGTIFLHALSSRPPPALKFPARSSALKGKPPDNWPVTPLGSEQGCRP